MNNSEKKTMNRKTLLILVGGVLGAALIAWLVLVIGIFGGKTKKNNEESDGKSPKPTVPAEVPEGMVVVFRATAEYTYDEDGKRVKTSTAQYDDFGRITEWTYYSEDGSATDGNTYRYDEKGNLVEKAEICYGEILERYVMTYDENGVLLTRDTFFRDNEQPLATEYYNKNGKVIKEVTINATSLYTDDGELYERKSGDKYTVQSVLSDDGRILERTNFQLYHTVHEKFVYDEATGKLTEMLKWNDGELTNRTVYQGQIRYTYDNNGEPFDPQNPPVCQKDTLDEYGNVLSSIYESRDGAFSRTDYEYSPESAKKGKYIKQINYDRDGTVMSYVVYEYSKAGQELKEITYAADGSEFARHHWIFDNSFDNYIGYYWELDENGNPARGMAHLSDRDVLLAEYEYIPMVIPEEYMYEDEEHYLGIRKD